MGILKILIFSFALTVSVATSASFQDICLSSHNKLRDLHKETTALQWDSSIAAAAQKWADELLAQNSFNHDEKRGDVGENLYSGTGPKKASCAEAALDWYNELSNYNYANPLGGSSGVIGHFTQLVWKSTHKIGVGVASKGIGSSVQTIIVARYSPAGNVYTDKAYKENVMALKNPNVCSDAAGDSTCHDYNSWGFCDPSHQYYKYMPSYCAKTCKLCK